MELGFCGAAYSLLLCTGFILYSFDKRLTCIDCIDIEYLGLLPCRNKVTMLNTTTEVINFWQTEGKRPTAAEAREKFPDCFFRGQ